MRDIGFIGVGAMGAPIAARLIDAGYRLTVYDTNPAALDAFRGRASVAKSPAGCAALDAVVVLVADAGQAKQVLLGEGGVVPALREKNASPQIVVMSTIHPDVVRELSQSLEGTDASLVDAPISGGIDGAASGRLSVMVGGRAADVARSRALLETIGHSVTHCGPLAAGMTTKILNNLIGVANWLLMAEAMSLASRLGLDLAALAATMEQGSGRNIATGNWPARQASYARYVQDGALFASNNAICRKDLDLVLSLAESARVDMPVTQGLSSLVGETPWQALQAAWSGLAPNS
ncbi:NAD(P)-dependent oxidoreductase [Ramlibacter sp.]|uniref:NAD(P)-dependent oxidoreductase n=1 Tax=Ramlibacter sp. TaxID=1917967 RepID=UPI003D0AF751